MNDTLRNYHVYAKSGYKTFIRVKVSDGSIATRGERRAVALAAWQAMMGENVKGEVEFKRLRTRNFLHDEIQSRPEEQRDGVFETFMNKIKFILVTGE